MSEFSYDLIKKALDVSALRQKAISSNIANINTPDYKVNKVEFEEYLKKSSNEVALKKNHKEHFGESNILDLELKMEKRESTALNSNGNNVDIDLEMTELAANEIYYNILVQQLNAKLANLNYVINR